jgi:o-succinylbenzoate synthase
MTVERIRVHRIVMPMRTPFTASHGTEGRKHATVVEVIGADVTGWGECAALEFPTYTEEFADGAFEVLTRILAPAVLAGADWRGSVSGNPMAKAGLDLAMLDHDLRLRRSSLITYLEAEVGAPALRAVPAGLSIGITRDLTSLLAIVDDADAQGYQRVRMKIEPGWDFDPAAAIRSHFPRLALQVDANGAYSLNEPAHIAALKRLEPLDLLMIEQPLAAADLDGHARLARQLSIPVCLDEPIISAEMATKAIALGACSVVNIKVARLGGLAPTLQTLDVCRSTGSGAWCGGMLDTGIGRAVNIAIAALPGFTSPGDIAATNRYFDRDIITTRFEVVNGMVDVPQYEGIGVDIDRDALRSFTIRTVDVAPA